MIETQLRKECGDIKQNEGEEESDDGRGVLEKEKVINKKIPNTTRWEGQGKREGDKQRV